MQQTRKSVKILREVKTAPSEKKEPPMFYQFIDYVK